MTPTPPPDGTASERSAPGLALARASRPRANGHQQPSRRQQMLNAAAYAALKLDQAAEHDVDPAELRLAAEGLRAAALRLGSPKPPRQPRRLPRPGDGIRAARDVSLEELSTAAAIARAIADAGQRPR